MRRWVLDGKLKVKNWSLLVMLRLTFSVSKLEVEIVRLEEQNIKRARKQPQCTPLGDTSALLATSTISPSGLQGSHHHDKAFVSRLTLAPRPRWGNIQIGQNGSPHPPTPSPATVPFFHICLVSCWFLLQSWFLHSDSWLFSPLERYSFLVSFSIDHLLINKLQVWCVGFM